jgi:hypothetical protein
MAIHGITENAVNDKMAANFVDKERFLHEVKRNIARLEENDGYIYANDSAISRH